MSTSNGISVILAGGQSRRMGTDKRFLPFKDSNFIGECSKMLSQIKTHGFSQVLVASDLIDGFHCVPDLRQGQQGPLAGIEAIFEHILRTGVAHRVLFVPVDMPRLTLNQLERMTLVSTSHNAASRQAIAFDGFELPVILRVDSEVLSVVKQLLDSPLKSDRSIRKLLSELDVLWISNSTHEEFKNINTREEYRNL